MILQYPLYRYCMAWKAISSTTMGVMQIWTVFPKTVLVPCDMFDP